MGIDAPDLRKSSTFVNGVILPSGSIAIARYALTSYGVAQRRQDIGLRMGLGARAHQVMWLFLGRTAAHLAVGLILGVFGALAAGRLLQTFLVQTSARDPLTLAVAVTLLALVAITACLFPARRAARLDPLRRLAV